MNQDSSKIGSALPQPILVMGALVMACFFQIAAVEIQTPQPATVSSVYGTPLPQSQSLQRTLRTKNRAMTTSTAVRDELARFELGNFSETKLLDPKPLDTLPFTKERIHEIKTFENNTQ